jgi:hypothetical protein
MYYCNHIIKRDQICNIQCVHEIPPVFQENAVLKRMKYRNMHLAVRL